MGRACTSVVLPAPFGPAMIQSSGRATVKQHLRAAQRDSFGAVKMIEQTRGELGGQVVLILNGSRRTAGQGQDGFQLLHEFLLLHRRELFHRFQDFHHSAHGKGAYSVSGCSPR